MKLFLLPKDIDLAEFEMPFATPEAVVEFVFARENDSFAYKVLRMQMLDFTHHSNLKNTDWNALHRALRQYPELPHLSLAAHGLFAVFRAGRRRFNSDRSYADGKRAKMQA